MHPYDGHRHTIRSRAGYYASGFVVREEELLYSQYGTTVLSCAEGAHVAANDTVATGYRSEDARLRQTRMDELSGQIEQLQYAWSAVSSVYDQAALDTDIADALAQLSRYLALRDMNSVSDLSPDAQGPSSSRPATGTDGRPTDDGRTDRRRTNVRPTTNRTRPVADGTGRSVVRYVPLGRADRTGRAGTGP